ncbi:MAG: S-layer protein, partial [Chthoniobacteraceae bacterium]
MKRPSILLACILSIAAAAHGKPASLQVEATGARELTLRGKDARQQLLVTAKLDDGAERDFTHKATYAAAPAGIVNVDANGIVTPLADGTATVTANAEGVAASLPV